MSEIPSIYTISTRNRAKQDRYESVTPERIRDARFVVVRVLSTYINSAIQLNPLGPLSRIKRVLLLKWDIKKQNAIRSHRVPT